MRFLLLVISALILATTVSTSQPGPGGENSKPHPQEAMGALDIRIHPAGNSLTPPAELLVTDPQGARTGCDPRLVHVFSEIAHSSYEAENLADALTGSPGPETRIIHIRGPLQGEYTLQIIGTVSAGYTLEIRGYDRELNPSDVRFPNVHIVKNEEHRYLFRYMGKRGAKIVAFRD